MVQTFLESIPLLNKEVILLTMTISERCEIGINGAIMLGLHLISFIATSVYFYIENIPGKWKIENSIVFAVLSLNFITCKYFHLLELLF